MHPKAQVRHQLFLPKEIAERFETLAAMLGATKSSLLGISGGEEGQ